MGSSPASKPPAKTNTARSERPVRNPVLIRRSEGLSISKPAVVQRTGLRLPKQLTMETWEDIGRQITRIGDSSAWWIADWIVFGQEKFPDRYKKAAEQTGLSYQTLRNYAWVARSFPMSRRRDQLSFQHHALVAAMNESEQDQWLERAAKQGLSAIELRKQIGNKSQARKKSTSAVHVTFPEEKVRQWQAAAEAEELNFIEWVTILLDSAAKKAIADIEGYSSVR